MTGLPEDPPRWLAWAGTPTMRAITTLLALVAFIAVGWLGMQQQSFIRCLADQQRADAARTVIISDATDAERRADAALVNGPQPGGPSGLELRRADVEARRHTDDVRAAHPAPPASTC
jgi:hypothetical protein